MERPFVCPWGPTKKVRARFCRQVTFSGRKLIFLPQGLNQWSDKKVTITCFVLWVNRNNLLHKLFFLGLVFWELQGVEVPKRVVRPFFGVIFFNLRELGGSNQKLVVHSLKERKKIGEDFGFWGLSIGPIVSEKIGFLWKIRENFSLGCPSERKNDVTQKILTPQSYDGQIIC